MLAGNVAGGPEPDQDERDVDPGELGDGECGHSRAEKDYAGSEHIAESLAKRIWEVVRNDGTPVKWKYLGIISCNVYYYYINARLYSCLFHNNHWYTQKFRPYFCFKH